MVVKAISTPVSDNLRRNRQTKNQQQNNNKSNNVNYAPSFKGSNPIVMLMDAIDRGGFAASFIAQDGIGMVAPRIKEGLNRGRKEDENGKKHGPLNWEFARKEGVREILSGPSAFIIPAIMLHFITKHSGSANNVSIDTIKGLGQIFETYATENRNTLSDIAKTKKEFYENVFKNVLNETLGTENGTKPIANLDINKTAAEFTNRVIEIENAKSKGFIKNLLDIKVDGSAEDLTKNLADDFMMLKKENLSPSVNEMAAHLKVEGRKEPVTEGFNKLLSSMKNYSNDAIESVTKQLEKDGTTDVSEFLKTHTSRRIGSRFTTIMSMFLAVVGFYTVIPKLYNLGLKGNPALNHAEESTDVPENKLTTEKEENKPDAKKANGKDIPFQGAGIQKVMAKTGDTVMSTSWLKKLADKFDFDGPSMSVTAMLTLLFGFCLPPRYINGQDKYDKKEILVRDISSFAAILFGAKALSRACSQTFSKLSGLALNTKPADHANSLLHKVKNYFTAGSGIHVLTSAEITSKYSNIDKYKGGINGFFDFVEGNGGNIKKMLGLDKNVKANAEAILGKPLKNATIQEIKDAFKNIAPDNKSLQNIYKEFKNVKGNKYINYAKTMNSTFGALSTLALVPMFMIWLARYCDRMTKNDRAKEKAAMTEQTQSATPQIQQPQQVKETESTPAPNSQTAQPATIKNQPIQKQSMAGFLKK